MGRSRVTRRRTITVRRRPGVNLVWVLAWLILATGVAVAGDPAPIRPAAGDKCPVCGMFTAKHPDFVAQLTFADGVSVTFDGPKDLFKFILDLKRYDPAHASTDIASIRVTEYYDLSPIDARTAWFVIGSDVSGPMGGELVPFATGDDAEAFRVDHRGTEVLRFEEVSGGTVRELDKPR